MSERMNWMRQKQKGSETWWNVDKIRFRFAQGKSEVVYCLRVLHVIFTLEELLSHLTINKGLLTLYYYYLNRLMKTEILFINSSQDRPSLSISPPWAHWPQEVKAHIQRPRHVLNSNFNFFNVCFVSWLLSWILTFIWNALVNNLLKIWILHCCCYSLLVIDLLVD